VQRSPWTRSVPLSAQCSIRQRSTPLATEEGTIRTSLMRTLTPSQPYLIICTKHTGLLSTAPHLLPSASNGVHLQRVVRTAQYITGAKLPAIQDFYTGRRKALKMVKDPSHPSHRLFSRYRSAKSRTKRLLNCFYPQAIRMLNS
jgi:hypothetical protein